MSRTLSGGSTLSGLPTKQNHGPHPGPIETFLLQPPDWRPPLSGNSDLGFPDFYPSRPGHGQDEDRIDEINVKSGFTPTWNVGTASESFSVHGLMYKELSNEAGLACVNSLFEEVLARREAEAPVVGPSTFKIPARYTVQDSKRATFRTELADPSIPLHQISKRIPHGYKGVELMDMLFANGVPFERGLWFIKVIGGNESIPPRGRPPLPPTHYSTEWTHSLTTYLKKQLSEIVLPSVPRTGFILKQPFKSIFSDPATRAKWLAKWNWSTELLRRCFKENLVDRKVLYSWFFQAMGSANLAQLGFVGRVVEEYVDGLVESGHHARSVVEVCLVKIGEIWGGVSRETLCEVDFILRKIVQVSFLSSPYLFVAPRMWSKHSEALTIILSTSSEATLPPALLEDYQAQEIISLMRIEFEEIKARNMALLFTSTPGSSSASASLSVILSTSTPNHNILSSSSATIVSSANINVNKNWSPRRQAMIDINLLDSIGPKSNLKSISDQFFSSTLTSSSSNPSTKPSTELFYVKLNILLSWSISYSSYGYHRPYAVSSLLKRWASKHRKAAARFVAGDDVLQNALWKWLDESKTANKAENLDAVASTFGELARCGLFSYAGYLQSLIAKGLISGLRDEAASQHHLNILKSLPLFNSTPSLLAQRRVALYGVSGGASDDNGERLILEELDSAFADSSMFLRGTMDATEEVSTSPPKAGFDLLMSYPRFVQIKAVRKWIGPYIQGTSSNTGPLLEPEIYARMMDLLERIRDFATMLDFLTSTSDFFSSPLLVEQQISAYRRYIDVWVSMEAGRALAEALMERYLAGRSPNGKHDRETRVLLGEMKDCGLLSDGDARLIEGDATNDLKGLLPSNHLLVPPPLQLPEVLTLPFEPDSQSEATITTTLWYKYNAFNNWAYIVWDNVVLGIENVTKSVESPVDQYNIVMRYASFLHHIHQHLPNGLDQHIKKWFTDKSTQSSTSSILTGNLSSLMTMLFLQLMSSKCLEAATVINYVVLPIWKESAMLLLSTQQSPTSIFPLETALSSAHALAHRILLADCTVPSPYLPPISTSLCEIHRMQTARVAVYDDSNVVNLVNHLPYLAALEVYLPPGSNLSSSSEFILETISKHITFKAVAFRHQDILKDSFLRPHWLTPDAPLRAQLDSRLVDSLKLIMSDNGEIAATKSLKDYDWGKFITNLNPWRWPRSVLELQLSLKQLSLRLVSEDTKVDAEQQLDNLLKAIFERDLSGDETDLISEAWKGVDSPPVKELVDSGLQRLVSIMLAFNLDDGAESDKVTSFLESVGNVLRILAGALGRCLPSEHLDRSMQLNSAPPPLDILVPKLHTLLSGISTKFSEEYDAKKLRATGEDTGMKEPGEIHVSEHDLSRLTVLLVRVVNLLLAVARSGLVNGTFASTSHKTVENYIEVLIRIATIHSGVHTLDETLFNLCVDTIWCFFEEIPKESHPVLLGCLGNQQSSPPFDRHPMVPPDQRSQLKALFPYVPPEVGSIQLAIGPSDNFSVARKVTLKPWEYIEDLEPVAPLPSHKDSYKIGGSLRNSTSLNLANFGAEGTRDIVSSRDFASDPEPWMAFQSERRYVDGLDGDLAFERNWVGSLVEESSYTIKQQAPPMISRPSTALSAAPSPAAASSSSALIQASPSADNAAVGQKRKATGPVATGPIATMTNTTPIVKGSGKTAQDAIGIDDDDVVEVPKPSAVRRASRGGKSVSGGASKRPATGGKVPSKVPRGGKKKGA